MSIDHRPLCIVVCPSAGRFRRVPASPASALTAPTESRNSETYM